ncbi:MAG: hypothetical protein ACYDCL_22325 [Myxococcales bacterium]
MSALLLSGSSTGCVNHHFTSCDAGPPEPLALPSLSLGQLLTSLENPANEENAARIAGGEESCLWPFGNTNWHTVSGECPPCNLPAIQIGLNDTCFAGVDGGFPLNLEAFLRDLTDRQCRPALADLSAECAAPGDSSFACTPSANACATNPSSPPPCSAGVAPAPASCVASVGAGVGQCGVSGDTMGNPAGTFIALEGLGTTGTQLFVRFPDAVANQSLTSNLADLIATALFRGGTDSPPALSQSFAQCGIPTFNALNACGVPPGSCAESADVLSFWLRDQPGFSINRVGPAMIDGSPRGWAFDADAGAFSICSGETANCAGVPTWSNFFCACPADAGTGTVVVEKPPEVVAQTIAAGGSPATNALHLHLRLEQFTIEGLETCKNTVLCPTTIPSVTLAIDVDGWFKVSTEALDGGCPNSVRLTPLVFQGHYAAPLGPPLPFDLPAVSVASHVAAGGCAGFQKNIEGAVEGALEGLLANGFELPTPDFCFTDLSILPSGDFGADNLPGVYLNIVGTPVDPPAGDPPAPIEAAGVVYESVPGQVPCLANANGSLDCPVLVVQPTNGGAPERTQLQAPVPLLPLALDVAPAALDGGNALSIVSPSSLSYLPSTSPAELDWAYPYNAFTADQGGFQVGVQLDSRPTLQLANAGAGRLTYCVNPSLNLTADFPTRFGRGINIGPVFSAFPTVVENGGTQAAIVTPTELIAETGEDAGCVPSAQLVSSYGVPVPPGCDIFGASYPDGGPALFECCCQKYPTCEADLGLIDPPSSPTSFAAYLPPDIVQQFSGPVAVTIFRPSRRCHHRHPGRREHGFRSRRGQGRGDGVSAGAGDGRGDGRGLSEADDDRGCDEDGQEEGSSFPRESRLAVSSAATDPPVGTSGPSTLGIGTTVTVTNSDGGTLSFQPTASVSGGALDGYLCGQAPVYSTNAPIQPSSATLCDIGCEQSSGGPVPIPPALCCLDTSLSGPAIPPQLGVKQVGFDLKRDAAQGFLQPSAWTVADTGTADDPDGGYVLGLVPPRRADSAATGPSFRWQEPQRDPIVVIGASDRPGLTAVDVACYIAADGTLDVGAGSNLGDAGNGFPEGTTYVPMLQQALGVQIAIPLPLAISPDAGYSCLDGGLMCLPAKLVPYEGPLPLTATSGEPPECFLHDVIRLGSQPVDSAPYLFPDGGTDVPVVVLALPTPSSSACYDSQAAPILRIDALGLCGSDTTPLDACLLTPGALVEPSSPSTQLWAGCAESASGAVSCANYTPAGTAPANAFPTTLTKLLQGEYPADGGGLCPAPP